MRTIIELGLDFVARIARAPFVFARRIFRERIATLDHETFDDPMKSRAIIESLLRQLLEVFDCLRRYIGPKLQDHFTGAGLDHGHFIGLSALRILTLLSLPVRS